MAAITLTGNNAYLIAKELRDLEEDFRRQHSDMGIEKLEADDIDLAGFLQRIQSVSLLADRRFISVRGLSHNKLLSANIEQIISSLSDEVELVIVEPQLDKRTHLYKILRKLSDWREFTIPDERKIIEWVMDYVREKNGKISRPDAAYLVMRLTAEQQLLENELNKLLNFQKEISRSSIDLLTESSPQSSVFDLLNAAFSGSAKQAVTLYGDLRQQNIEPLYILAMIGWQVGVLALVSTANDQDAASLARETGLNPYVIRKSQGILRKLNGKKLEGFMRRTVHLEYELKTRIMDADEAVLQLLIEIALGN